MTPRLTTDNTKNYCNRTLIVKVIVENVVTCFLWDTVYRYDRKQCEDSAVYDISLKSMNFTLN